MRSISSTKATRAFVNWRWASVNCCCPGRGPGAEATILADAGATRLTIGHCGFRSAAMRMCIPLPCCPCSDGLPNPSAQQISSRLARLRVFQLNGQFFSEVPACVHELHGRPRWLGCSVSTRSRTIMKRSKSASATISAEYSSLSACKCSHFASIPSTDRSACSVS